MRKKELYIRVLLFLGLNIFGLFKFYDVLFKEGFALVNHGDGLSSMAFVFMIIQQMSEGINLEFFTDTYQISKVAIGFPVFMFTLFQKVLLYLLSIFFSPDNIYDMYFYISFVLNGFFFYVLSREIGVPRLLSIIGAFFIMHMEDFFYRAQGHMYYSWFLPIIAIWACIKATKEPSIKRIFLFSFLSMLSFAQNPYMGYFCAIFSFIVFLGYLLYYKRRIFSPLIIYGVSFSVFLLIAFPNHIFLRIVNLFLKDRAIPIQGDVSHSTGDFNFFSVKNIFALFNPGIVNIPGFEFLKEIISMEFFKNTNSWEFNYRVGLILPIFSVVFLVTLLIINYIKKGTFKKAIYESLIWISACFVIGLFGLSPDYKISLVPITMEIGKMIRVGVRSYAFVDIGMIVLFLLLVSWFLRSLKSLTNNLFIRNLTNIFLICIVILVSLDLTYPQAVQKMPIAQLPNLSIYKILHGKKEGILIELPCFQPIQDIVDGYKYWYCRTEHGFPIYAGSANPNYRAETARFANYVNHPNKNVIQNLKIGGVRYLSVNKGSKFDYSYFEKSRLLNKLAENENKIIYEIIVEENFQTKEFMEWFIHTNQGYKNIF
ncbi:MAG: hypothetical protein KDK90_04170 [Leptospiraceae bacterium]|nr:hypothetical protein [Leptospiraceae bacterium]